MIKVLNWLAKLIDDTDGKVSLKALCIIITMLLVVAIITTSLIKGTEIGTGQLVPLLAFVAACLGLSLPALNK